MPHRRVGSERARLWPGSFTCPAHAMRKGPSFGTRQSLHRPLDSGLSLPVSPADKLGREWSRQKRVEKVECVRGKPVQSNNCVRVSRHQRIE
jgi:hypothetical protein